MRLIKQLIAVSALAATFVTSASNSAFADCAKRHFYNHSNIPWTLAMGKGAGSCSDSPTSGNIALCTIKPGQVGEIHYASTFGAQILGALGKTKVPDGNIMIASGDDGKTYAPTYFEVQNGPTTCNLKHSGSTGNVVLNDPAAGDIATCGKATGGNYDCRR